MADRDYSVVRWNRSIALGYGVACGVLSCTFPNLKDPLVFMHCMVYTFVAFCTLTLNHLHSSVMLFCDQYFFCCPLHLSSRGGPERRHWVFCHVGQRPLWRGRLLSRPVQQKQRVCLQTPPPGKPPQRVRSGSERLAVRASLQRLPVRAGETEPVWTDASLGVTGEALHIVLYLPSCFKAVWYSPCNIKRQNYHWSIKFNLIWI